MKIIQELLKAIYAKYQTSTLWTTDAVPFYEDHIPNDTNYPCIVYKYISSVNGYAMPNLPSHVTGYDYVNVRIQISVVVNDRQYSELEDYADRIEDVFNKTALTLGSNCTHICTWILAGGTKFHDQQQKIWTRTQDYLFVCGK